MKCETYTDVDACLQSCTGRLDSILGTWLAQRTLRVARMDKNVPLYALISIFSLRRHPPCHYDSSSLHATPLPATLQLAGSTRLSFPYRVRVAGRWGEKIRLQHRHIRKFLQETLGWTEFNTFLAPSFIPLHSFLTAFPFPHNSPNSTTPFFFLASSCPINTNTNCAARQLPSINSSPPNQIPTHAITQHQN